MQSAETNAAGGQRLSSGCHIIPSNCITARGCACAVDQQWAQNKVNICIQNVKDRYPHLSTKYPKGAAALKQVLDDCLKLDLVVAQEDGSHWKGEIDDALSKQTLEWQPLASVPAGTASLVCVNPHLASFCERLSGAGY